VKLKHRILLGTIVFSGVAFQGYSLWFKANAQAFFMPSNSMAPTLPLGARVIGWMHAYDAAPPRRGDLALLNLPLSLVSPGTGSGTTFYAKRVVGVPGDRIELKRGVLTRNGVVQSEPFTQWKFGPPYDLKILNGRVYSREAGGPWTRSDMLASSSEEKQLGSSPSQPIPPDRFLVLGDNRGNSNDSHVFGLVPRPAFQGRIGQQYWPRLRSF